VKGSENTMLVPAICHKDEIEKLFAREIYTDKYFYYSGYAHSHELPNVSAKDYEYQYAIVTSTDKVIGYLAYRIDSFNDCVYNFGLYSFDRGNPLIGKDLFEKMEELVKQHHRLEWKMISGNPVQKHYENFCYRHHGHKVILHDVRKDNNGKWHDEHIYEIVKNECFAK
jgi:hypothetical protein